MLFIGTVAYNLGTAAICTLIGFSPWMARKLHCWAKRFPAPSQAHADREQDRLIQVRSASTSSSSWHASTSASQVAPSKNKSRSDRRVQGTSWRRLWASHSWFQSAASSSLPVIPMAHWQAFHRLRMAHGVSYRAQSQDALFCWKLSEPGERHAVP